jgi:voltage-gated potassium channel
MEIAMNILQIRKLIYCVIIKPNDKKSKVAHQLYNAVMTIIIVISLLPLTSKASDLIFDTIDYYCVIIFILDYICRWITADIKYKNGLIEFFIYPLRPMAIIDLLSILPTFTAISNAFSLCRTTRLVKTIRLFKVTRQSKEIELFFKVIIQKRYILYSIFGLVGVYILFTSLLLFNLDDTFETLFDAIYWVATSNNDIIPSNRFAQIISILSSVVGISIVTLPSCIITASYLTALKTLQNTNQENDEQE